MNAVARLALSLSRPAWHRIAAAVVLAATAAAAQARGGWSVDLNVGLPMTRLFGDGYGYGNGYGYGGAPASVNSLPSGAVSVQVGGGRYWRHGGNWYRPWGPRWVLVAPPIVLPLGQAVPIDVQPVALPPAAPSRPDPVIEPRNGQDTQQTEYDRQQCDRWATTQPAALADASVFQRAVAACLDGRGYTLR